jgi:hypothetical protein
MRVQNCNASWFIGSHPRHFGLWQADFARQVVYVNDCLWKEANQVREETGKRRGLTVADGPVW